MRWLRSLTTLLLAMLVSATLLSGAARAATLVEVTNFGTNPSNLRMYLYVPDRVRTRPAVLVASHYCTGSGPAYYSGSQFAALADQYGFIVIYPSATRSGQCFDVSSPETLRHNGGSDSLGIVSMVRYVLQRYGADPDRVYATGGSSGAMMTNVLLGAYPDVFKAGAAFAGVPFGCFATTNGSLWNSACAGGTIIMTPQQWGDLVRAAYPGYSGPRPRMQVWHGTEDTTLRYQNFLEEIKQWTNVHGLSQTPAYTDRPQTNWTRTRYGGTGTQSLVEAISIQGAGHGLPGGLDRYAIQFLGLDTVPPTPTATRIATPTPATPTHTPTPTNLPGTIQVENYDSGGEGVAYHDTDATNSGGAYRPSDGVDIETTADSGGGYSIGWTQAGEWTRYTANVATAGTYTAEFRVASANTGASFHLEVDGTDVTGPLAVPNTGGWQTWQTVTRTGINLSAGQHVLRLVIDGAWANYNWMTFQPATTPTSTPIVPTTPPTSTPIVPTTPPTATPIVPTATPASTPTPGGSTPCSPVTGTITAPFNYDGAGTFCWQIATIPSYINSWNLDSLTVNGVSFTNLYATSGNLPPQINGFWYISYRGSFGWSHFEVR